jgi:hypothetical protein
LANRLYAENKALLKEFIEKRGLIRDGESVWVHYDPPLMLWLLRRNEAFIPVEKYKKIVHAPTSSDLSTMSYQL